MRLPGLLLTILLTIAIIHPGRSATPSTDIQVRVTPASKDSQQQLLRMGWDVIWVDAQYVDIVTGQSGIDSLEALGYKTEIIHASMTDFYRSRLPVSASTKDMGGYKTLDEIYFALDQIIADYPNIVSAKQSIGQTIEGRDQWAVKISDNPNIDEDEPEVLFTAAIHCREVITPELLLHCMNYLTTNYDTDPEVQYLVDNREIWLILVCNPDGYRYNQEYSPSGGGMWRKNRRDNGDGTFGIDLNRNFGYMWGYDDNGSSPYTGSDLYRGSGPFSEPESQNLRDFTISHNFVLSCYYHAYSNVTIIPYGYASVPTPDDDIYRQITDTIFEQNGYLGGSIQETIFYSANGGTMDWEYAEQTTKSKVFGLVIEVGSYNDGFWPPLSRVPQLLAENLEPFLFMTSIADRIYTLRAPTAPEITVPSQVSGDLYTVAWTHTDSDNPAVTYDLLQLQHPYESTDGGLDFTGWINDGFAVTSNRYFSEPSCFHSGNDDSKQVHLDTEYPLAVEAGDMLTFRAYYDIEFYYDFAYVEVSTDGVSFVPIAGSITTDFDPNGLNRGNGITGSSGGGWVAAEFDLAAYVGQNIYIRFTYETDGSIGGAGFYIDDIFPHLIFDEKITLATDLPDPYFEISNQPAGVYYYRARARDAQDQYSVFSDPVATDVYGSGIGDLDVDGVAGSAADLALFNLYFHYGMAVWTIDPAMQISNTDINCDGLALSVSDLATLESVVIGTEQLCSVGPAPEAGAAKTAVAAAGSEAVAEYVIEIQSTAFETGDSCWVDIVLTEGTAGLLGYQFHLEYDTTGIMLQDARLGDDVSNWQRFSLVQRFDGLMGDLTMAASAWTHDNASPPPATELGPLPLPKNMARLVFLVTSTNDPFSREVKFVWNACGDNTIVSGGYDGPNIVVNHLAQSRNVYDAALSDITGLDPRYGGTDYTCRFGMFGADPTETVDFTSGSFEYDPSCCVGQVGDANNSGEDEPSIGDVAELIDHLFIDKPPLVCVAEGDVNQSGGVNPSQEEPGSDITIGDVADLVNYLFIATPAFGSLPDCL